MKILKSIFNSATSKQKLKTIEWGIELSLKFFVRLLHRLKFNVVKKKVYWTFTILREKFFIR